MRHTDHFFLLPLVNFMRMLILGVIAAVFIMTVHSTTKLNTGYSCMESGNGRGSTYSYHDGCNRQTCSCNLTASNCFGTYAVCVGFDEVKADSLRLEAIEGCCRQLKDGRVIRARFQ